MKWQHNILVIGISISVKHIMIFVTDVCDWGIKQCDAKARERGSKELAYIKPIP